MTQRSMLLKVISIIMIILGAIMIISSLVSLMASSLMINELAGALNTAEITQEFTGEAFTGAVANFLFVASIVSIIAYGFELFCGIFGLVCKSKKAIMILGMIVLILNLIGLIMNIVQGSFQIWSLIGFVLPILYFIGARQCIQ